MEITQTAILEALNAEDIESLLEAGAPINEYSCEADSILSALADLHGRKPTEGELASIIRVVWIQFFVYSGMKTSRSVSPPSGR